MLPHVKILCGVRLEIDGPATRIQIKAYPSACNSEKYISTICPNYVLKPLTLMSDIKYEVAFRRFDKHSHPRHWATHFGNIAGDRHNGLRGGQIANVSL